MKENQIKLAHDDNSHVDKKAEVHSTLHTMLVTDQYDGALVLDNTWRGAEAYHLYLLTLRQLYHGYKDESLKTVCFYFCDYYVYCVIISHFYSKNIMMFYLYSLFIVYWQ